MLKVECRRAFLSVGLWVGAALYLFLMVYESWADYTQASGIDMVYLYDYSNSVSFMLLLLPVIAALPHGMSFAQDWNSRYVHSIWLRVSLAAYVRAKVVACFCSGGTCLALPAVVFMLYFGAKLGFVNETSLEAAMSARVDLLPLLLLPQGGVALFMVMRLLGIFLYGGMCALMALAVSAYLPYGYIAVGVPFVCLRLWVYMIDLFHLPLWLKIGNLNRMIVFGLSLSMGERIALSVGVLLGLAALCAAIFALGVRRRKENA